MTPHMAHLRGSGISGSPMVPESTRSTPERYARADGKRCHARAMPDPDAAFDYRAAFPHLTFDRPFAGVLRITLDGPGLNAVDPQVHRELADVWLAVDRDDDTNVALLQGAGKAFSSGGSFDLIQSIVDDYD